jgi:hypothetical protein
MVKNKNVIFNLAFMAGFWNDIVNSIGKPNNIKKIFGSQETKYHKQDSQNRLMFMSKAD